MKQSSYTEATGQRTFVVMYLAIGFINLSSLLALVLISATSEAARRYTDWEADFGPALRVAFFMWIHSLVTGPFCFCILTGAFPRLWDFLSHCAWIICDFAGSIWDAWRPETVLRSLSYWVPRRYREVITGDIIEDCHEMRALGMSRLRICTHVVWQFAVALILLWPTAVADAFKKPSTR
jgi:hypothetical protein